MKIAVLKFLSKLLSYYEDIKPKPEPDKEVVGKKSKKGKKEKKKDKKGKKGKKGVQKLELVVVEDRDPKKEYEEWTKKAFKTSKSLEKLGLEVTHLQSNWDDKILAYQKKLGLLTEGKDKKKKKKDKGDKNALDYVRNESHRLDA